MKTKMAGFGPKLAIGGVLAVTALVVGASIDWRALAGKAAPQAPAAAAKAEAAPPPASPKAPAKPARKARSAQ